MGVGRPSALDKPFRRDEHGNVTETVADRLVALLATGSPIRTVARSVGVSPDTVFKYMSYGAQTHLKIMDGKLSHPDDPDGEAPLPEPDALRAMAFSERVQQAQDEWRIQAEARLEGITRASKRTRTVTKRDANGAIVETITTTEDVPPDAQTLRWRLTLHPATRDDYRPHPTEHTGPDNGPIEVNITNLMDRIRRAAATQPDATDQDPDT